MTRKLAAALALVLFACPFAHADEASKRAKIDEMFTIMHIDATLKQVVTQSAAQGQRAAKSLFGDHPISDSDQKIIDSHISQLTTLLGTTLDWNKLKPQYTDLYAAAFTEDQVDGIIAFYKSPSGQALLTKTPDLMSQSQQIVQAQVVTVQPQLRAIMMDLMQQVQAAHSSPAPASSTPAPAPAPKQN